MNIFEETSKTIKEAESDFHPIKKRGNKYVLIGKKGQVLGTHDTYNDALQQLKAVQYSMHGESFHEAKKPPKNWKPSDGYLVVVKGDGDTITTSLAHAKDVAKEYNGKIYYNVDWAVQDNFVVEADIHKYVVKYKNNKHIIIANDEKDAIDKAVKMGYPKNDYLEISKLRTTK